MADIVRRDPFRDMRHLMERVFDDSLFRPSETPGWSGSDEGTLALDISQKDGNVVVRSSLPGFKKEDIDVQLHNGVLSIKAEHSEESEEKGEKFYRRERRFGSVSRRVALPGIIHDSEVEGELKDGVLTLTIPIPEKAQPKKIEITG